MENYSVYQDIANRTGGDVYIGVVGPVRTGKSTFIRRFMETLVIPNAESSARSVMTDELPQAAGGKTVMTTEPKFVPAKAAKIQVSKGAEVSVRLVDCVGFAVSGASGFEEDGAPRLVRTPWSEEAMPFEKAAEIGTEKVIREHSTIGVLVTTDGSVTGLARADYERAEERAVAELQEIGKPFVILLNCAEPSAQTTLENTLSEKYGVPVVALNAEKMTEEEILSLLKKALFEFPVTSVEVKIPKWLQSFPETHPTVAPLLTAVKKLAPSLRRMRDCFALETLFETDDDYCNPSEILMDLGTGKVEIEIGVKEGVFYRALSAESGESIDDELALMRYTRTLTEMKRKYDKIKDAFSDAEQSGYGIVRPCEDEYALEKPKLVKKNAGYGVQFKASATSYHILKVEVGGQVHPIIGTKAQSEEFLAKTQEAYAEEDGSVWETNIFGKSLKTLVGEELSGKTAGMPNELRLKMRRITSRIVNDGKTGVLCILF